MKKLLSSLILFGFAQFLMGVNVTFVVNMSTFPDGATDSTSTVDVRGDFNGWADTDVLTNVGGDYWSVTLDLTSGETYGYKFTHTDDLGNLTWEGDPNRSITIPASDTTAMHYFGPSDAPYAATDSIDVWFRVNMGGVIDFDPTSATVGVRGSDAPLDWGTDLALAQEGDSYFYSGQASFANDSLGQTAEYKFVYDMGSGVQWEGVDNRTFTLDADTTLAWKWFNDQPAAADIDTFQVTFTVNTSMLDNVTDSTAIMFVTGDYDGWDHWNDTCMTVGDYHSKTLQIVGDASGVDLVYKFVYQDPVGDAYWESVADRPLTVTEDTEVFHYWDDVAPFTATDDIDVWFRVNMEGVAGFDSSSATVGVRGGESPLDWGTSIDLNHEGDSWYYSGLISFPADSAGQLAEYKFVYDQGGVNWEGDIANRTFTLGADTTLAFQYFNDEPPTGEEAVTAYVYFTVDMEAYEDLELFSVVRHDSMQVRGGFNGWAASAEPDGSDLKMTRITGTTIYELNAPVTKFPNTVDYYKYYIKWSEESLGVLGAPYPDVEWIADWGYEVPPTFGAGNRDYTFVGDPDNPQQIGLEYYMDLPVEGIIPDGQSIDLTFSVDMNDAPLFDAATDTVWLLLKDPILAHLTGYFPESTHFEDFILNDDGTDGDATADDGIYSLAVTFTGKFPFAMVYVYEVSGENTDEEGGGFDYGRFRCRYINPSATGNTPTWPSSYEFPMDTWSSDPPLVVEEMPELLSTDDVSQVPTEFKVYQNYPNPFNPTTEIKFVLPEAGNVTFAVYNLLGQQIVSYKHDFTAPGTYGFQWNGKDQRGNAVSSGVYFYEVTTPNHRVLKKMTLLK